MIRNLRLTRKSVVVIVFIASVAVIVFPGRCVWKSGLDSNIGLHINYYPWNSLHGYFRAGDGAFNILHSQVHLNITQLIPWPPLVDGITMKLTCTALIDSNYSVTRFIDMQWTGLGLHKSLWVKQLEIKKRQYGFERTLYFDPWLDSHAGVYTCRLIMKNKDNDTFVIDKTKEVKGEYRGLINSRNISQKFNKKPVKPSQWFPNANLCGNEDIWQEYADFHASVISGKQKGRFLLYKCMHKKCGGYGNRVQSITSLLLLAMLTKHVFLLQVTNPIDINEHLLPNAIQWNYIPPKGLKSHFVDLFYTSNFEALENALLLSDEPAIVSVRTFYGIFYYLQAIGEQILEKLVSTFSLKTHYDLVLLYGCTFNYLFKYQPKVTQAIDSLQNEYNLKSNTFIALHVRSHFRSKGHPIFNPLHLKFPFQPMFECAAMAAKTLSHKVNVSKVSIFLTTDDPAVTEYAKNNYPDMIIFSNAPTFHIDLTKYKGVNATKQYEDGIMGILSDIEICSRGAVLVRSKDSSFSEEMGILHYLPPQNNLHPFYFYENLTLCENFL